MCQWVALSSVGTIGDVLRVSHILFVSDVMLFRSAIAFGEGAGNDRDIALIVVVFVIICLLIIDRCSMNILHGWCCVANWGGTVGVAVVYFNDNGRRY